MNRKKILLTRPEKQNSDFVKFLYELPVNNKEFKRLNADYNQFLYQNFVMNPVLDIQYPPVLLPPSENVDGILITSGNAIVAADILEPYLHKPVYIVGEKTMEEAQYFGFKNISLSAQTVKELVAKMRLQDNLPARLLYLRGKDVSFDIKASFPVGQIHDSVVYDAQPIADFTEDAKQALYASEVAAVTFFSGRSAEIFLDLIRKNNMMNVILSIKALCISQSVLDYVQPFFSENSEIAEAPDSVSMLNLVQKFIIKGYITDRK